MLPISIYQMLLSFPRWIVSGGLDRSVFGILIRIKHSGTSWLCRDSRDVPTPCSEGFLSRMPSCVPLIMVVRIKLKTAQVCVRTTWYLNGSCNAYLLYSDHWSLFLIIFHNVYQKSSMYKKPSVIILLNERTSSIYDGLVR